MKIRIDLEITEVEFDSLVQAAIIRDWRREEPRKSWKQKEKLEAARYAICIVVEEALRKRN